MTREQRRASRKTVSRMVKALSVLGVWPESVIENTMWRVLNENAGSKLIDEPCFLLSCMGFRLPLLPPFTLLQGCRDLPAVKLPGLTRTASNDCGAS